MTAAGIRWGTFVVGGSDSYCYVHQAVAWSSGTTHAVQPLALEAPWPQPALTFAPAGHIPSAIVPGAIAPLCPPGLSLVMAPMFAIGGVRALFLVVPLFGAVLVLATYFVGARFAPRVGVASALLTACSPAFLFQVLQPMSDVPAAALWVLAVACAAAGSFRVLIAAGLATSGAILMRPNLLPLGLVIGAFLLLRPGRSRGEGMRDAMLYAACSAPGCVAVAVIQWSFYGSPFQSGYGSLAQLFSTAHIGPNAARYLGWLWQTHTPIAALAIAAPFLIPGWLTSLMMTLVVVNLLCYLPYTLFNDWWYLRFLLPTIPLLLVLMTAALDGLCRRIVSAIVRRPVWLTTSAKASVVRRSVTRRRKPDTTEARVPSPVVSGFSRTVTASALSVAVVVLAVLFVRQARARSVFDLQRLEARYEKAGTFVARRLPSNALVITSWESGSVRFYSDRPTLVWDVLDPAWLDRAVAFVRARGFEPFLLLERWEEPQFRQRFGGTGIAALDWPPMAEIAAQVRIYRPEDRERYQSRAPIQTEYVR